MSTAPQSRGQRTGRLQPLFPLRLFRRSVVVGRRVELEHLGNFGSNIRVMPSLTMRPLPPSPSPHFKLPASLCSSGSRPLAGSRGCAGAASLCCRWDDSGLFSKNDGLDPEARLLIRRLMVK